MARWASGAGRKDCGECRAAFAPSQWDTEEEKRRKANGPPCETCRPALLPGNEEAWMIYQRCSNQVIADMGGPIDINILAVKTMMDLEGVEDQRECLARVQVLAGTVIAEQRKASRETPQDEQEAG